jgi:hypothetical protein
MLKAIAFTILVPVADHLCCDFLSHYAYWRLENRAGHWR